MGGDPVLPVRGGRDPAAREQAPHSGHLPVQAIVLLLYCACASLGLRCAVCAVSSQMGRKKLPGRDFSFSQDSCQPLALVRSTLQPPFSSHTSLLFFFLSPTNHQQVLVTGLVFFSLFPNNLFPTGNRSHIHSFIRLIHPTCLDIPCAIHSTAATPGSHTPLDHCTAT